MKSLHKVRVAVLAVDGFEQVEVTLPMAALRRAGADVRIISLRPGRIRGMNFVSPGRKLAVDDIVDNVRVEDYGALLLPGGFVNPDLLRQSEKARALVRAFDEAGRPIAVICHGPEVLISAGLVRGRKLTSWPGIRDDVRNAGGEWVDEAVVHDRNWVSSRSPLDLHGFIPAMIERFAQAPRLESRLRRRWRPAAWLSRGLTLGSIPLLLAMRGGGRRKRRARGPARWLLPAALALAGSSWLGRRLMERRPRLGSLVSKGYRQADLTRGLASNAQFGSAHAAQP